MTAAVPPAAAGLGPGSLIGIAPGRSLRWAPDWPCSDTRIVFDRHSGDYWALAADAAVSVHRLQDRGEATLAILQAEAGDAGPSLLRTLDALLRADLLRAWNDGVRIRPGLEVEDAD